MSNINKLRQKKPKCFITYYNDRHKSECVIREKLFVVLKGRFFRGPKSIVEGISSCEKNSKCQSNPSVTN